MKLSNKILFGFFGFAFIYLTAVFAEVRLRGIPNIINDNNSIAETVDMPGVSYLVLQNLDKQVNVVGSDRGRLEVRSISGDLLQKLNYKVSGDTLTLSELKSEELRTFKITFFVPKAHLKAISVNASEAIVKGLDQELLIVSQNAGRTRMSDNKIGTIQLDISDRSYVDMSAKGLDTLRATIDNSDVHIAAPIGFLRGSMKNKSSLRASDIHEIQFLKDDSSRLSLYY